MMNQWLGTSSIFIPKLGGNFNVFTSWLSTRAKIIFYSPGKT